MRKVRRAIILAMEDSPAEPELTDADLARIVEEARAGGLGQRCVASILAAAYDAFQSGASKTHEAGCVFVEIRARHAAAEENG
jgi:hypothetical protein